MAIIAPVSRPLSASIVEDCDEKNHSTTVKIAFSGFENPIYHVSAQQDPPSILRRRSYRPASVDLGKGPKIVWLSKDDVRAKFSDTPAEVHTVLSHFPDCLVDKLYSLLPQCTKVKTIGKKDFEAMVMLGLAHREDQNIRYFVGETVRPVIAGQGQAYILFSEVEDVLIGSGTKKWVKSALGIHNGSIYVDAICHQDRLEDKDWKLLFYEVKLLEEVKGSQGLINLEATVEHAGEFHFITNYFNCTDLQNLFKFKKGLSYKEKVRIAYQISLGLLNLHTLGIVHRDLNPSNIFVAIEEMENQPRSIKAAIGDLGGASKKTDQEILKNLTGALAYLAPEKLRSFFDSSLTDEWVATSTFEADIWALGLLFFSLFHYRTGTLMPFQTDQNIVDRIRNLTKLEIHLELENARLELQVRNILLHMLQIEPGKRPPISLVCKQFMEIFQELQQTDEKKMPS